jgi:hypothetical protein
VAVPTARRRSPLIFVGVALIGFLILVGAGGYAVMSLKSRSTSAPPPPTGGADLSAPPHEVARYWIEVENSEATRAGESIAMQSGDSFKFHFSPNESGYLYIVGPGPDNSPTAFLTFYGKDSASGVNSVASGRDFVFPADTADRSNWITLDRTAGIDEFNFVFSTSPLTAPAFLAAPAPHVLTPAEVNEWESFQSKAKANATTIEVIKTGASPQTAVKVAQNAADDASVVFRVRIEHR